MADSENSRTLPANTRENLLSQTQAFLAAKADERLSDFGLRGAERALAAWREWNVAWQHAGELCRQQQTLEKKILDAVGAYPHVVLFGETDRPVQAQFNSDIERWLPGPENAEARRVAIDELADKHRQWTEADAAIGFEAALVAEAKAEATADGLAQHLWAMPAESIVDVLAKLHALLEMDDPAPWHPERPWMQLRVILSDLSGIIRRTS
jgi:hypothetical protein